MRARREAGAGKKGAPVHSILIMDDDFELSVQMARALRASEFDVDAVATAQAAKDALRAKTYAAVISDIIVKVDGAPVADGGISLINWIKSSAQNHPEIARIPVLAITGAQWHPGMEHILATAKQLGADATLEKPFGMGDLVRAVQGLIERA